MLSDNPPHPSKKYCVNLPHRIKNLEKECVSFSSIQMSTPLLISHFEMGLPTSERLSVLKSFLKLFPEPRYKEAGHGGALILPCISLSPNPATSCLFSPRFTPTDLKPLPPVKRQVCISQTAELGLLIWMLKCKHQGWTCIHQRQSSKCDFFFFLLPYQPLAHAWSFKSQKSRYSWRCCAHSGSPVQITLS